VSGLANRLLQVVALYVPGAMSVRPRLHRLRGVTVGKDVFIGFGAMIETSRPELVCIRDRAIVGIRATIVAHFFGMTPAERNEPGASYSVVINEDAFLGPNVTILPGVEIGEGAVVAAGSVVTASVAPRTLVQGNPARPVARCGVPLSPRVPLDEFYRSLRPIRVRPRSRP
jgi:acetyltransferase-like isoleucine patch superfamily enzyme